MDLDEHPQLWVPPAELVDLQMLSGGPPRHGLGRGLKVSKETIIGLLTALELFRSGIYDSEIARQHTVLERIVGELQGIAVSCAIEDPGDSESSPLLEIALDEAVLGQTAFDVCRRLREGNPSIYPGPVSYTHLTLPTILLV